MQIQRIVPVIDTEGLDRADAFYGAVLGLRLVMDHGWVRTYAADGARSVQVAIASAGGSGAAVPDLSIEVDDLEEALARVREAAVPVVYGPVVEPWGVRRFYVHDPFGRLVNVLQHVTP